MQSTELADLIRRRRTSMLVDRERPVPHDVIRDLCELAQWAPNHKRTWPLRIAIAEGAARARLGDAIAEAMQANGDAPEKVDKTRTKYLRTPTTLVVGSAAGDSPQRTAENRDSVAAGIQIMLLAATAHGLASYWSSCPKGANETVADLCGFEPGTHISGLIYLGWPTSTVEPPMRPAPEIHHLAAD
ncbi:MAG: nitroreductase family protein [Ilumatobacteraceae bacterium]